MARVLVISPHPDDEAIGCGGTLCAHITEGDDVQVLFLTSGEQGGHGRTAEETCELREREAAQSAKILSVSGYEFWRQPDGYLDASEELVQRLRDKLSDWKPHWIYVPHEHEMHVDHRAAAQLVRRAVATPQPKPDDPVVRMYEIWTPLEIVHDIIDISAHIDRKLQAVRAHQTQCQAMRFDEAIAGLNRYRGEMHSWPGGDFAEAFRRMHP